MLNQDSVRARAAQKEGAMRKRNSLAAIATIVPAALAAVLLAAVVIVYAVLRRLLDAGQRWY